MDGHGMYLCDLLKIASDIPGYNSESMRRVIGHLEGWRECSECCAEANGGRLPNAETAFRAVLEDWNERSDISPFVRELQGLSPADIVSRWPLFALFQLLLHKWQWKQQCEMGDADASLGLRHPLVAVDLPIQELVAGFRP